MNDETRVATVLTLPLKSMRLRPGMALQTKRLVEGSTKKDSQFLAAIEATMKGNEHGIANSSWVEQSFHRSSG